MFEEYYKYKKLTKEKEINLFNNLTKENRDEIIKSHLYIVLNISQKYKNLPQNAHLDLVHNGILGLIEAIPRFDPQKGVRFSYYCQFYIKSHINLYLRSYSDLIYIPSNKKYKMIKENKVESFFDQIKNEIFNKYKQINIVQLLDDKMNIENINKIINQMDSYYQKIIYLRYYKSLSWRDISKILKKSHEKIRQDHFYVIDEIKINLNKKGIDKSI